MDADRAATDRKIEEAATEFFAGEMLITQGREATERAVATLVKDLGQAPGDVASLLGIDVRVVKQLAQAAGRQSAVSGGDDTVDQREEPGAHDEASASAS